MLSYVIAVVLLLLIYLRDYIRTVFLALKLKGPKPLPIVGNCFFKNDNTEIFETIKKCANKEYGQLVRVWIGILPMIVLFEPRHLKIILGSSRKSRKNFFYSLVHNSIGGGLPVNNGEKWKRNRTLLQPYFRTSYLEKYVKVFVECSHEIVEELNGKSDVKITVNINKCVQNILHKSILGITITENEYSPFKNPIEISLLHRLRHPWFLFQSVFNRTKLEENDMRIKSTVHGFLRQIMDQHRRNKNSSIGNESLMEWLMAIKDNNPNFSDEDVINESVSLVLGGLDPVAKTIAFTLYYLAKYHEIQDRVYEEIELVIGNHKDVNIDHVNKMEYLEQCIKEAMRLAPAIPIISRILNEDVQLDDYILPKGTTVGISPIITHRLADCFPDPLAYNPSRFSPENIKKIQPFSYLPFSLGVRNCIGSKFAMLEMKTIISLLLKNYDFSLRKVSEELTLSYHISLAIKGGLHLKIRPRK